MRTANYIAHRRPDGRSVVHTFRGGITPSGRPMWTRKARAEIPREGNPPKTANWKRINFCTTEVGPFCLSNYARRYSTRPSPMLWCDQQPRMSFGPTQCE